MIEQIERWQCWVCSWFWEAHQLRKGRVCPRCGGMVKKRTFTQASWEAFLKRQGKPYGMEGY